MVQIGGIQKFSTVDYPGHTCAAVFLIGCNMRAVTAIIQNSSCLSNILAVSLRRRFLIFLRGGLACLMVSRSVVANQR